CGAIKPTIHVVVQEKISVTESLAGLGYAGSKSKWSWKFYSRPEFFRRDGVWHRVQRFFDKPPRDRYVEHITDARSGTLVHHFEEPLTDPQGHGSARANPP